MAPFTCHEDGPYRFKIFLPSQLPLWQRVLWYLGAPLRALLRALALWLAK